MKPKPRLPTVYAPQRTRYRGSRRKSAESPSRSRPLQLPPRRRLSPRLESPSGTRRLVPDCPQDPELAASPDIPSSQNERPGPARRFHDARRCTRRPISPAPPPPKVVRIGRQFARRTAGWWIHSRAPQRTACSAPHQCLSQPHHQHQGWPHCLMDAKAVTRLPLALARPIAVSARWPAQLGDARQRRRPAQWLFECPFSYSAPCVC